ncbi:dTDP-4-dehydrorhamnose 3,5-epimerase family protein [Candidatus Daviesbacteria bacterium]|nr:dTDP-4-dehydrorhamnose 3,5-epimerase family protein [Candidatus Daviesbacteria bacterium]
MEEFAQKTTIKGLLVLKRPIHQDERGFFREVFHLDEIEKTLNLQFKVVQMNHAHSSPKVLRGIHAENWNKIICPVNGQVFVAIVDIRVDSPTFGQAENFIINNDNRIALFVSRGLANSYCVIGNSSVDYIYLVDAYWDGADTRAIAWDDPDVAINWPIKEPILSQRDKNNPRLRELFPEKFK